MTLDYEVPPVGRGQTYFWVITDNPKNASQYVIVGYRNSEAEAYKFGFETLPGRNFKVVAFETRNRHEVAARLKGRRLTETRDLEKALTKCKHYKAPQSGGQEREA